MRRRIRVVAHLHKRATSGRETNVPRLSGCGAQTFRGTGAHMWRRVTVAAIWRSGRVARRYHAVRRRRRIAVVRSVVRGCRRWCACRPRWRRWKRAWSGGKGGGGSWQRRQRPCLWRCATHVVLLDLRGHNAREEDHLRVRWRFRQYMAMPQDVSPRSRGCVRIQAGPNPSERTHRLDQMFRKLLSNIKLLLRLRVEAER